ncbi:mitochondrial import protein-like protein mmp37 [Cucurbitaria berberidis CBS 394.84]|uniref:Phosphatidate cytidylyltransferase, mitochondrial n=1 Tax=Cucurbitaria berberidis CBS 394.84 TaxID=1168544 RepID=A0A9P4GHN1_9PLEO|nr:mitochondrial import protein-like protein mmp37 [Cucurbitaria berberidis CBS 394.84]KAF1845409.1 mitochondrial import protein-like protein mmp37 [Cucurbitaria berberidis CBS 394.84]
MHRIGPLYRIAWCRRPLLQVNRRFISSQKTQPANAPHEYQSLPPEWEDEAPALSDFTQLPHKDFGKNQLMETNEEFKRSLRGILKQFPPITYAFAYGSGVFPQSAATASRTTHSPHPNPPEAILKWQKGGGKMIDFILTPRFSQHFHSLNLREHRDHYSFLGSLGSGVVSHVQDKYGAGAYFNPYITVNGTLIKYGVVNFETLLRDLTDWDSLYFAGRLQKPVKILFEEPNIRVANQRNLLSAVRCALLLLPPTFTEKELYSTITGLSYQGDPRMQYGSENPKKIDNIVTHQIRNFRLLYHDLIMSLPNIRYADDSAIAKSDWIDNLDLDLKLSQDMDPERRANMVRRLPKKFREKVYFQYRGKFGISGREYQEMLDLSKDDDAKGILKKQVAGAFDKRIAGEKDLPQMVTKAINQTVKWPSTVQSLKGPLTAGPQRSWRYLQEKREKARMK